MIVRPQQHWIRLIFVWHGSVLSKIFSRLLLNFLLSIAVIIMLPWYTMLGIKFTLAPFSILGVAIAIFLGFRNNACYARYVEARTERFVYAGNGKAEKALNLAGQCVGHYDTAGLMQTDSVALTGAPLSVTRRLLKDADNPDTVADWQGADALAWNDLLDREAYTTLTTADVTGAVLTTTDAKGNLLRVTYDVAGLLSGSWLTLKDGTEQAIVKSLTYSAAGQKLREEHGNGVVTTYEYEPQTQRLVGIKTERPAGHAAGAKVLQDLRYEYDPVGNVLKISNDAEETRFWRNQKVVPENRYTCDSLYQLVSATGREMANAGQQGSNLPSATIPLPADSSAYTNYTRTYTYDSAGNLTQISHSAPATGNNYTTDITVSDRSNRGVLSTLTENPSGVDALFTAGGQQKQLQPGQNLVWTPRNELLQVTPVRREGDTGDRESYRYDTDSQRLQKVSVQKTKTSTQTQRVVYLPGLELRTTSNGKNETERLQVITVGETGRAQVRVLHWQGETPEGISNDQLRYSYDNLTGSSQLELNGKGEVITVEEYYPYGGTAVWTACSAMEAAYKTIRYSGKERDATGLYYYGYRYYLPWAGRWLSADPAGTIDGMNLFRMVRNNPVTLRDALGMDTEQDAAIKIQSAFRGYLSRKAVSVKSIHGVIHTHISSSGHITLPENTRGREVQSRLRIGASYDSLLVQGGAGNFDVYHKPDNAPVMNTTSLLELNNVSGTKAFLNGGFFANNESLIMPSDEVTGEKFKGHIIGPAPERHNKVEIPIQWRDRAEAWTGGVKYDANNIYLAANYTRTYDMTYMGDTLGGFAHKTDNWEMVGQYQFDNGLRPSLAFLQSRANDVNGLGSFDLVKYIDVGSYYYFNKNMSAYVDYKINLLKDGNPSNPDTDNTVALGLVYEF